MTMLEQIDRVLLSEGGYVDNPADPGGATNMGITIPAWREYCRAVGRQDIDNHPRSFTKDADAVPFYGWWWSRPELGLCAYKSAAVQYWAFDTSVLFGRGRATRFVQTACNALGGALTVDGFAGQDTTKQVNLCPVAPLIEHCHRVRVVAHQSAVAARPSSGAFLNGWIARAERLRDECLEMCLEGSGHVSPLSVVAPVCKSERTGK